MKLDIWPSIWVE